MPETARQTVRSTAPAALVEQAVALVRQSAAVDEARLDTFLDGAVVAAEQVQDTRLNLLEQPAEVSAADVWVEISIGLLIDSKLISKALSLVARNLFGGVVRSNAVFLALPKSASGKELSKVSKQIASTAPDFIRRGDVLTHGFRSLPGTASKESLRLYHASIQLLVNGGSELDIAQAAVKAVNTRAKTAPRSNAPLAATDSAGVAVLSAALDYAAATRLGIRFRAARIEAALRQGATLEELALIAEAVDFDPLEEPGPGSTLALSLSEARAQTTLFMEALIWSRMYGFSFADIRIPKSVNNPQLSGTDPEKPFVETPGVGPGKALQQYWLRRFQAEAARYAVEQLKQTPPLSDAPMPSAQRLLRYFAAISVEVDKQGVVPGALTRRAQR